MGLKTIIDVEMNDQQWKSFQAAYAKYETALAKAPKVWEAVNEEINEAREEVEQMQEALSNSSRSGRSLSSMGKDFAHAARQASFFFVSLARDSKQFAANIARSTASLIRWTGLATGIAGLAGLGGSLWGLDRLAGSAAAGRRSSQGLGLGYGEQQAFALTYGRAIDAQSFLGGVSTGKGNIASSAAAALFSLGINPTSGASTGSTALEALTKVRQLAQQTPNEQLGILLQSRQLGELGLGIEDLRRLKGMSNEEFEGYGNDYRKRAQTLDVADPTLKKWQDLTVSLDEAGKRIKNVLIDGLAPLAAPLGQLSDAFSDVVRSLLGSNGFRDGIRWVAEGLQDFANYVKTEEFKNDVKDFASSISMLARKTVAALRWLGLIPDPNGNSNSGSLGYNLIPSVEDAEKRRQRRLQSYDQMFGGGSANQQQSVTVRPNNIAGWGQGVTVYPNQPNAPKNEAEMLSLIRKLEGSPDINGVPQTSPAGAVGRYQIMPRTAQGLGFDPNDRYDPDKNEQMAKKLLAELSNRYNGNLAEILADYNGGPRAVAHYRAGGIEGLRNNGYGETARYLERAGVGGQRVNVNVKVENATGANTVVSASGMGFPQ